MNTIRLRYLTLVVTLAAVIFLSGCGGNTKEQERQRREAEDIVHINTSLFHTKIRGTGH